MLTAQGINQKLGLFENSFDAGSVKHAGKANAESRYGAP
jgi:hypothetical protein